MNVTVSLKELKGVIEDIENHYDDVEYLDIVFGEPFDLGDGTIYPKHIQFDGYDGYGGGIDFGDIKHHDIHAHYRDKHLNG